QKKKKKKRPAATAAAAEAAATAVQNSEVDIDAWLRDEEPPAVVENSKPEKKTKKKKKLAVAREAYEETSGVCTPSNPNLDRGISPRMSHCTGPGSTKLCSNSDLSVDFASTLNPGSDEVVVRLGLLVTGPRRLKNVEANVVDTLNARMVRSEPGFLLPTPLSPGEHGELRLHFAVASKTTSQMLRGTITYLAEEEDGSVPGKLDFKVPLRCTDSLLSVTTSKNDFSQLLAGGRVDFSASAQFASEHSFRDLLTRITFVGHFSGEYYVLCRFNFTCGKWKNLLFTSIAVLVSISNFHYDTRSYLLGLLIEENVHIGCKTGDQKMADTVVEDLKDICTRR
ncbi:hypothetical protein ANCCAN_11073, partial [Ancylostoma caninum]